MKLIAGTSSQQLAQKISDVLGVALTEPNARNFADGEYFVEIAENVRGQDVFVIQSTSPPANNHLMELLITIEALRRSSARRITAVIPYYGYARQDRKTGSRTPITAKLIARLLETAGANRIVTADLHSNQIQGFFNIPTDNLYCQKYLAHNLMSRIGNPDKLTIVAPDVGGVARARAFAKRLECDLAIIDKRRPMPNQSEVINIVGNPAGRDCLIFDDIIDTAGTLCGAAEALHQRGARSVMAACVHGVFSNPALERIDQSPLSDVFVTNSIQPSKAALSHPRIHIACIGELIAHAIKGINEETSISALFED
ncbi:MAG: ribose-phosphate pyrophosphokinase [Pseudomonadota bacterium]